MERYDKEIQLIMTDLDGTFILNGYEPVEANVRMLRRCRKRGIPVVPVTARNFCLSQSIIARSGFTGYAITNNGSSIQNIKTGENVWENPIANDALSKALDLCVEAQADITVLDSFRCLRLSAGSAQPQHMHAFANYHPDTVGMEGPDELIREIDGHAQLMRIKFRNGMPDWFMRRVNEAGAFELTSSHATNVEIMAKGSGKRYGVAKLAKMLSVPRESIMACGDQQNDVEMLQWAGIGVAMGDATDAAKKAADYISLPFAQGGVAHAVEHFVLNRNEPCTTPNKRMQAYYENLIEFAE